MEKDRLELRVENLTLESKVEFTTEEVAKIAEYKKSIDLTNTTQVIQYGSSSQLKASAFATEILKQVQTRDLGET